MNSNLKLSKLEHTHSQGASSKCEQVYVGSAIFVSMLLLLRREKNLNNLSSDGNCEHNVTIHPWHVSTQFNNQFYFSVTAFFVRFNKTSTSF